MRAAKSAHFNRVLFAIAAVCLLSFKIIIVPIGSGATGIRIDDFLILIAFFILLYRGDLLSTPRSQAFKLYLLFVAVNLLSTLWNSAIGRVNPLLSLVFDVRLLQYMLFYFLGYALRKAGKSFTGLFVAYCLVMCAVIPLQLSGLTPDVSLFAASRASGNTNGPYEFAAVAGFLLCYLGYKERKLFYGFASIVFVVLTASRVTLLGVVVSLFRVLFRVARRSVASAAIAAFSSVAAVLLLAGVYMVSSTNANGDVMSRISSTSSTVTWSEIQAVYATAPIAENYKDYAQGAFSSACAYGACDPDRGDPSTLIRLYRWSTLIRSVNSNLSSILIGLGPSFGTEAVDGYYVRLYAETGLTGLVVFFIAVWGLWRAGRGDNWPFREYVVILLFTACFIDIFASYKPMLLLWLWHGSNQYKLDNQTVDA